MVSSHSFFLKSAHRVMVNGRTVYYVGVRKDGAVLGINDPDGVMLQIVNFLIQDV